jgi:hypothetical protein
MSKEKRGLGTGLDVLFAANAFEDEESELLTLPLSKVEPRQEQPRERFDKKRCRTWPIPSRSTA